MWESIYAAKEKRLQKPGVVLDLWTLFVLECPLPFNHLHIFLFCFYYKYPFRILFVDIYGCRWVREGKYERVGSLVKGLVVLYG